MENLFFIDNHSHGAYGVDFNYSSYNEIKKLLKEHYNRGILGICPTLVGDEDKNIYNRLKLFRQIKEEQLKNPEKECFVLGVHLEGTFLSPNRPGIQDKFVFKKPTAENFNLLTLDCSDIIKIVTIAPEEDEGLIDYLNSINILTQAGHTTGTDVKNCKGVTHLFNAMNPIYHRNPSIALEGLIRDDVYIEVIADFIHLSKEILSLIFKTKPKDKILVISDSLPCAHYEKDIVFCNKKINPTGLDDKGTLAGSNKTIDEICNNLIKNNILSADEINQVAFYNQIKYLKLSDEEITRLNYFK